MNPIDLIFEAASNLTGGIINDLTTAVVALAGLMMLVVGFKKLQNLLFDRQLDAALRDSYDKQSWGGVEGDIERARYKRLLALKTRKLTGEDC